jgi:hypothetical protein
MYYNIPCGDSHHNYFHQAMRKYQEAPWWWYAILLLLSFFAGAHFELLEHDVLATD